MVNRVPWKRRWNPDESKAAEQWAQEQADREDDLREPVQAEDTGRHWNDRKKTR